jgi:hypothetical protein
VENPHHEVLTQVLKRLQGDNDRDVRYFASLCPSGTDIEEVCNHKTHKNFSVTVHANTGLLKVIFSMYFA